MSSIQNEVEKIAAKSRELNDPHAQRRMLWLANQRAMASTPLRW